MYKEGGEISPLECKNKKGDVNSIHFEEGDVALFNGGTTVHQVPPNNDPNSERTVLSYHLLVMNHTVKIRIG